MIENRLQYRDGVSVAVKGGSISELRDTAFKGLNMDEVYTGTLYDALALNKVDVDLGLLRVNSIVNKTTSTKFISELLGNGKRRTVPIGGVYTYKVPVRTSSALKLLVDASDPTQEIGKDQAKFTLIFNRPISKNSLISADTNTDGNQLYVDSCIEHTLGEGYEVVVNLTSTDGRSAPYKQSLLKPNTEYVVLQNASNEYTEEYGSVYIEGGQRLIEYRGTLRNFIKLQGRMSEFARAASLDHGAVANLETNMVTLASDWGISDKTAGLFVGYTVGNKTIGSYVDLLQLALHSENIRQLNNALLYTRELRQSTNEGETIVHHGLYPELERGDTAHFTTPEDLPALLSLAASHIYKGFGSERDKERTMYVLCGSGMYAYAMTWMNSYASAQLTNIYGGLAAQDRILSKVNAPITGSSRESLSFVGSQFVKVYVPNIGNVTFVEDKAIDDIAKGDPRQIMSSYGHGQTKASYNMLVTVSDVFMSKTGVVDASTIPSGYSAPVATISDVAESIYILTPPTGMINPTVTYGYFGTSAPMISAENPTFTHLATSSYSTVSSARILVVQNGKALYFKYTGV